MKRLFVKCKNLSIEAKASIAYTFANLISKGINIITVPIFTRIMSTYEVGISTTYSSWYSILYAIVTLSLCSGSLNIAMLDYKERRNDYQSACLTLSTISGLIFLVFYLMLSDMLNAFTTLNSSVMCMLAISLIINPAIDFWYARQRYEYKYESSVMVTLIVSLLAAFVSIAAVSSAKSVGYTELGSVKVISQGIITTGIAFVFYIYIQTHGKSHFDIEIWKYALKLSSPLIVHTLAKNILDVSDRLMISSLCGKSDAGIYGTIYSLAMISLLVWNAINTSLIPTTFKKLERREYDSLNEIFIPVLVLFGAVSILVTLFGPEILRMLTTDEYYSAVYLIPPLCAGVYFTAMYNIYGNFLLFKKKTMNIMIATSIAALINIVLNYIFIKLFGYVAAAYTTLATFILLAVFQGIMVRIVFKEKVINDNHFLIISSIVALLCIGCSCLYRTNDLRYIVIAVILIALIIKRSTVIEMILKK